MHGTLSVVHGMTNHIERLSVLAFWDHSRFAPILVSKSDLKNPNNPS
jgi:hypothetical protein